MTKFMSKLVSLAALAVPTCVVALAGGGLIGVGMCVALTLAMSPRD